MIRWSALWSSALNRRACLELVLVGVTCGIVGVHVVLRRLAFFTSAIAHATLPGLVLAAWIGLAPLVGAGLLGCAAVVAVFALGQLRSVHHSSAVGVVLAGSFGLAAVLQSLQDSPSSRLSALLAGDVLAVDRAELTATAAMAALVVGFCAATHKELVLGAFDEEGARALGYSRALDLGLLLAVQLTVVTTVPAVGTVLSVALTTVPALTARLWSDRVLPATAWACALAVGAGLFGFGVSTTYDVAAGGAIALTAVSAFALSWLVAPYGMRSRRPARHGGVRRAAA